MEALDFSESRLENKEMVVDNWYPIASMRTLNHFLEDAYKYKLRVQQFYFIGAFLKSNVKHRFL